MYLSKFQIFNYKSFRDSGVLEFKPGINIIVGANNSGKTALLEALTLNFFSKPHRSLKILAEPNSSREHESSAKISFTFKKNEFLSFISHLPQSLGILHKSDERLTLQQKGKIFQRWLDNVEPSELIVSLIGERDNSPQNDIQIKGLSPMALKK